MFGRRKAVIAALREENARLREQNGDMRARVSELEYDFRGCMEHREKLLKRKAESLALRLPANVHDLYRDLARAGKDNLPPQGPADPIPNAESAQKVRGVLRQLAEAGEVL